MADEDGKDLTPVRDAFSELMKMLALEGYDPGEIGGICIGLGAGWAAAHKGNEAAYAALDGARAAIEKRGSMLN